MGRAEVLRTIKDAESNAERIREQAESEAKGIVSNARVEAAEISSKGRQKADEAAASIIKNSKDDSEWQAGTIATEGDALLEKVKENGKKNRSAAVEVVLSAFRDAT
jgi:vacuolar-type H+-ATPase subunit H|tara:strand:+ start:165 stop:485 length:321 start_codon:yes stop_codon:yes gene_type:complete